MTKEEAVKLIRRVEINTPGWDAFDSITQAAICIAEDCRGRQGAGDAMIADMPSHEVDQMVDDWATLVRMCLGLR